MIRSKSKHTVYWFGSSIDKLPNSTGKILFQHFYLKEKGEDIYELTNPEISQAFLYCRENERKNLLQSAIKICSNLNKLLVVIVHERNSLSLKQHDIENIYVITIDELKQKKSIQHLLSLFQLPNFLPASQTEANKSVSGKTNIKEVIQYIDSNLTERLSIKDFAHNMNYSISYFSKLFHHQAGISFQDYVINKRIEQAKLLLQEPEKISSIAYLCGYQDISYFSRIFKKRTGMTPQQYRDGKERI